MKKFFWTTIFWLIVLVGLIAYMKWFNQDLAKNFTRFIVKQTTISQECPICPTIDDQGTSSAIDNSWAISSGFSVIQTRENSIESKFDFITQQLKNINEKLDIQNSNAPDAVSVSLKTTKKTNIWIFPLDGSDYTKYVMPASDDILKDTLTLLFENSPFVLKSTKLDSDGNLTITLERNRDKSFGWSAAVEQAKTAIEKTATQFSQIKNVTILPEEVLQP